MTTTKFQRVRIVGRLTKHCEIITYNQFYSNDRDIVLFYAYGGNDGGNDYGNDGGNDYGKDGGNDGDAYKPPFKT